MKKLFFFFITSFLLQHNLFAQPGNWEPIKVTSLITKNEDTLYLSQETYWYKSDTIWVMGSISQYKYDINGNNTEERREFFHFSILTQVKKRFYDEKNHLIDEILFNDNYDRLDSIQRQTFFYDMNLYMKIIYELLGNNLVQRYRTNYYYDNYGNLIEEIEQKKWYVDWMNEYKYNHSYNFLDSKVNTKYYQFYNESWNFVQQDSFFYDQLNRVEKQIYYDDEGIEWSFYETKYSILSKEIILYDYSINDSAWIKDARWIYSYNIDSTLKEILLFENKNDLTELSRKWEYTYAPLSQLVEVKSDNVILYFNLLQNYPNPFNPTTIISYQIPQVGFVSLKVYDLLGREVAILVNEEKPTGNYEVEFDGSTLASGVYFYKLGAGQFVEIKKFLLLK